MVNIPMKKRKIQNNELMCINFVNGSSFKSKFNIFKASGLQDINPICLKLSALNSTDFLTFT